MEAETRGHRLRAVSEGLRVGKMFFAPLIKPLLQRLDGGQRAKETTCPSPWEEG